MSSVPRAPSTVILTLRLLSLLSRFHSGYWPPLCLCLSVSLSLALLSSPLSSLHTHTHTHTHSLLLLTISLHLCLTLSLSPLRSLLSLCFLCLSLFPSLKLFLSLSALLSLSLWTPPLIWKRPTDKFGSGTISKLNLEVIWSMNTLTRVLEILAGLCRKFAAIFLCFVPAYHVTLRTSGAAGSGGALWERIKDSTLRRAPAGTKATLKVSE